MLGCVSSSAVVQPVARWVVERHDQLESDVEYVEIEEIRVTLQKAPGSLLGASIGAAEPADDESDDEDSEVIVVAIRESGLIDDWNKRNPSKAVTAGDVIAEANGKHEPWEVMDELAKFGILELVFHRKTHAGSDSKTALLREVATRIPTGQYGDSDSRCCTPSEGGDCELICLPTTRASDAGVDTCAICIEDVDPDEGVAQLPACGHAFHWGCVSRWMMKGARRACPLCNCEVQ